MAELKRRGWMGGLVVCALVGAACGARVGDKQANAEARVDAARAGYGSQTGGAGPGGSNGSNPAPGAGGFNGASGSGGGAATGGSLTGAGGTGGGGVGAGTGGGGAAGSGGGGGVSAALPPGGNGGATDVGVTADEVRIGNVSSLTGPVPGLFRGALIGAQAFAAYQNSQGGVYGRRLNVLSGDDELDSGKNRAAHLQLKDQVFSFVGSFSTNDDGGVSVLQDCKCPDVGGSLSISRFNLPNHYDPQPIPPGWRTGPFNYFKQHYSNDVITHVAFYVSAIASARAIAANERKVMESLGYKIVAGREVEPNETNYTGDVIQMRRNGTKMIVWEGDVGNMSRLAAAMHQQGFSVTLANWGGALYDDNAFKIAGKDAVEGAVIDNVYAMFRGEDAARIPEVALFNDWMHRVDPNQVVDLFAFYGWLSARLFTEALVKIGPRPTRTKLLTQLAGMGTWDDAGAIAPINVGAKQPSACFMLFRIHNGNFERAYPTDRNYSCDFGGFQHTA